MPCKADYFDVIVVGSGHAGCEAALAAARMGRRTALFTLDLDKTALMPCNPSVGGPGKGHLVREVDALGGEMARNTDRTSVQIRLLNTGKGPAVQSLRAQSDKHAYSKAMRQTIELQPNLSAIQVSVDDLILQQDARGPVVAGIKTSAGETYLARAVVLTTGTFLRGRIIVGDESYPGGRAGEFPADALSRSLASAGFSLGRLKTGTPPRIDKKTIDFGLASTQPGSTIPAFLSYAGRRAFAERGQYAPSRTEPISSLGSDTITPSSTGLIDDGGTRDDVIEFETETWRSQLNCFLVHTNQRTHAIIQSNLHRAPMFNGDITSTGPRYCPSIETKIVRFAGKPSHQLFLEPEGWQTDEIYVQGANTSLPADVQLEMLRTIPALRETEIMRVGYAIEYDYIPASQVKSTLESKLIGGLFMAGQIIGTTGYEEAAALGIMAGINAGHASQDRGPLVLRRDQAYIGVLIDDLVTKDLDEPYRMHTSQAEYRLLLREDSAEARLSSIGHEIGLIDGERYGHVRSQLNSINTALQRLDGVLLTPNVETNAKLESLGAKPLATAMTGREALRRTDISPATLNALGVLDTLPEYVAREVETTAKYEGYIERQAGEVRRLNRMEDRIIPNWVDYAAVRGLRTESRENLERVRPRTVGQASRIGGVAPTDVQLLLFHLERAKRTAEGEKA